MIFGWLWALFVTILFKREANLDTLVNEFEGPSTEYPKDNSTCVIQNNRFWIRKDRKMPQCPICGKEGRCPHEVGMFSYGSPLEFCSGRFQGFSASPDLQPAYEAVSKKYSTVCYLCEPDYGGLGILHSMKISENFSSFLSDDGFYAFEGRVESDNDGADVTYYIKDPTSFTDAAKEFKELLEYFNESLLGVVLCPFCDLVPDDCKHVVGQGIDRMEWDEHEVMSSIIGVALDLSDYLEEPKSLGKGLPGWESVRTWEDLTNGDFDFLSVLPGVQFEWAFWGGDSPGMSCTVNALFVREDYLSDFEKTARVFLGRMEEAYTRIQEQ